MRVAFVIAAASFAAAAGFSQQAHAADCDVDYTIQPSDTLVSIAELAYGSRSYQLIYSANATKIKSLSDLPIGESITIPCIPGVPSMTPNEVALSMAMLNFEEDTESAPEAEAAETEDAPTDVAAAPEGEAQAEEEESATAEVAVEAAAEPEEPVEEPAPETVVATAAPATEPTVTPVAGVERLRLLTANGLAPFADKGLRKGGMATELAELALNKLGIQETSRIVFIDDRDSHLQDLLIDGSFDLGFPWFRPACEEVEVLTELSPEDAWLCQNFTFSEPFYEFVYGFFVRSGEYSIARTEFDDFADAKICRPAGTSVLDLVVKGLRGDEVTFVRPETLADCFALLRAEEVDAVSGEAFEAETLLAELGLYDDVEELPKLGLLQTVHAVAPTGKPGANDAIESLNRGLIELKVSGEWFRIVGRHLAQN